MPALLYNANGDIAVTPTLPMPESAGAFVTWLYHSSDTARQRIFAPQGTDSGLNFRGDLAGDPFAGYREGATYADAQANAANFAAYVLNAWLFLAFLWDGTDSRLYMGNLTLPPAEPSAYVVQTTIATPTTGSGAWYWGNESVGGNRWWRDRIAMGVVLSSRPSVSDLYRLWLGEFVPGALGFWMFGLNGTTNVPDVSGNGNHAAITSLDVTNGLPRANPFALWHPEGDAYAVPAAAGCVLPFLGARPRFLSRRRYV